jgi:type I restriction enzyme S subunit
MTLRQHGVALTTGPFGTVLAASDYIHAGVPLINPTHIRAGGFVPDPDISVSVGTAERLSRHALRVGDIVVGRHGDVGRSALVGAEQSGWLCGGGSIAIRPGPKIEPRFLQWALTSRHARDQLLAASLGATMDTINEPILMALRVWSPPVEFQREIADYLDTETARIDALIARKQRMIELLRERLRLAPEASLTLLRDESELVALKFLVQESDQRRGGDVARVLLSVSIHHGVVPRSEASDKESRADDFTNYKTCELGDVVINRMRAFQGAVGVVNSPGIVSPDYTVLRLGTRLEPDYVHYLMRSHWFIGEMASRIRGIGAVDQAQVRTPRVNFADLREIAVPVPPAEEQERLVSGWRAQEAGVRAVVERLERQAELLREHRQALITAAVTGELEVPGVAA